MGFIQCPNCSQKFKLNDKILKMHGRYIRCSKCNKKFEVKLKTADIEAAEAKTQETKKREAKKREAIAVVNRERVVASIERNRTAAIEKHENREKISDRLPYVAVTAIIMIGIILLYYNSSRIPDGVLISLMAMILYGLFVGFERGRGSTSTEKTITNNKSEFKLVGDGIKSFHNSLVTALYFLIEEKGKGYELPLIEVINLIDTLRIEACLSLNHTSVNGQIVALKSASQEECSFVKGIEMLSLLLLKSLHNLADEIGSNSKVYLLKLTPVISNSKDIILRDNPSFR